MMLIQTRNLIRKYSFQRNMNTIIDNINQVRNNIRVHDAQNKTRLVCVSKTKPIEDIKIAYENNERHFGESYVQELIDKSKKLPSDIRWHFIGTLQSNKCKLLASIPNLFAIETVTNIKSLNALNTNRKENGMDKLNVFLQVNTSGEETKSGLKPTVEDLTPLVEHILNDCDYLNLLGLMTIGSPENSKSEDFNPDFELLKSLQQQLEDKFKIDLELSMGMSSDYIQAIKQGATNVRVGSTIFGNRNYIK